MVATSAMKIWSRRRLSLGLRVANGPRPFTVPQMAMLDATNVTPVVPCCPKRSAPQITKGKIP